MTANRAYTLLGFFMIVLLAFTLLLSAIQPAVSSAIRPPQPVPHPDTPTLSACAPAAPLASVPSLDRIVDAQRV